MDSWRVTQAKAHFRELLDRATEEGPQSVKRRNQRFVLLTEEEFNRRTFSSSPLKPIATYSGAKNAWDLLRAPKEAWLDVDLPRVSHKARIPKL